MSQTLHVRCLVCGEVLSYQREETGHLLSHLRDKHPMLNLGLLSPLQSGTCDPEDCKKVNRDRKNRGEGSGTCDPSDCERLYREYVQHGPVSDCDPSDCERQFRERMKHEENQRKKKKCAVKIKGGCKPYCRVFESSEKSYPNFLPCGCGPGGTDKDNEPCGCDPYCEPKSEMSKGDYRRSLSAGRVNRRLRQEHNTKLYQTTVETWKPGNNKIVCPKCGFEGQPIVRRMRNKVYHSPLGAVFMFGCWPICFLPFMLCGNQVVNLYCAQCNHFLGTYDRKKNTLIEKCSNVADSQTTVPSRRSEPTICACKPDCQD